MRSKIRRDLRDIIAGVRREFEREPEKMARKDIVFSAAWFVPYGLIPTLHILNGGSPASLESLAQIPKSLQRLLVLGTMVPWYYTASRYLGVILDSNANPATLRLAKYSALLGSVHFIMDGMNRVKRLTEKRALYNNSSGSQSSPPSSSTLAGVTGIDRMFTNNLPHRPTSDNTTIPGINGIFNSSKIF